MQFLAMAMARCDLPVPVPPTSTALRCWAMKPLAARSCTSVWLIGVPSNLNSARSLASGSLAMELVLDRSCLLLANLCLEQIADDALGFVLAFDGGGHDLVEGGLHAIELELAHEVEELGSFHQMVLLRLS